MEVKLPTIWTHEPSWTRQRSSEKRREEKRRERKGSEQGRRKGKGREGKGSGREGKKEEGRRKREEGEYHSARCAFPREGRKEGSLKLQMRSHLARGAPKKMHAIMGRNTYHSEVNTYKTHHLRAPLEVETFRFHDKHVQSISKDTILRARSEVEMTNTCKPLLRKARFDVKKCSN